MDCVFVMEDMYMRVPMITQLVIMPEKKWNELEKAIEDGDTVSLSRILNLEKEEYETALIMAGKEKLHALQKKVDAENCSPSMRYFVYNSIPYDMPKEQVMDMAMRFADENHLPASEREKIRFIVANLDEDYLKYEAQYNESARDLLNEDDLTAVLSQDSEMAYHQEEDRREEEEKEEENATYFSR